jgi:hypothetical protein
VRAVSRFGPIDQSYDTGVDSGSGCLTFPVKKNIFLPPDLQCHIQMFSFPDAEFESLDRGRNMRTRTEKILIALTIAAVTAVAAGASETINYSYDSRGRLVQVKHSGTVNNNVTANYQYDRADNRTNVNVASPNPPP